MNDLSTVCILVEAKMTDLSSHREILMENQASSPLTLRWTRIAYLQLTCHHSLSSF